MHSSSDRDSLFAQQHVAYDFFDLQGMPVRQAAVSADSLALLYQHGTC